MMLRARIKGLDARKLRIILLCNIFLLLIIGIGSFLLIRNWLEAYANQVKSDNNAALISSNDVQRLKQLEQKMFEDHVAVTRAKNIVADSKSYQYQNQIINDITTYAKKSGVSISGFNFTSDTDAAVKTSPNAKSQGPAVPSGLKSIKAVISLKNPVSYAAIMRFIHAIELNLTKMQLTGISMTKSTNNSDVVVNPLTVEVFVR